MFSFPCSGYEPFKDYKFRSRSKGVFSVLFILSFAFVTVSTNTDTLSDISLSLNSTNISDSDCKDVCTKEHNEFCIERWRYLPAIQHEIIQIVLSVLFGMSILEWILESCYDFMPYTQLYRKNESKTDSDSEGQKGENSQDAEDALPLETLSKENEENKSEENEPSPLPETV